MNATDDITLLLTRSAVLELLPELDRELLYDYRARGDLRTFSPGGTHWAYYYTADVVRIQSGSRTWRPDWWEETPEVLSSEEFQEKSGLGRDAFYVAIERGLIHAQRESGHGRGGRVFHVASSELDQFVDLQ
jgi:hypothetical protein